MAMELKVGTEVVRAQEDGGEREKGLGLWWLWIWVGMR
jgi:hypothetical protein